MERLETLVEQFAAGVSEQSRAQRAGDWKRGNEHARRYMEAFERLRCAGNEGREALVPLLADPRDEVRAMAAAFLLRHRYVEARQVLEELARGEGMVAFSAGETLKRWAEGAWALDPPEV